VLILFAVMLTQSKSGPARLVFHHQAWAAAIAAILLALLLIVTMLYTSWPLALAAPAAFAATEIAEMLFEDYLLAFEVISLLLLAAVIGGIYLARREDVTEAETRDEVASIEGELPAGATQQ
jgi:NADH-quinone oxidoreductase subunit J